MRYVVTALAVACAAACALSACRTQAQTPRPDRKTAWLVTDAFAREHAARHQRVDVPFSVGADGTNGTALMVDYMDRLAASGGAYVSELAIYFVFRYGGEPVECKSAVIVDALGAPAQDSIDAASGRADPGAQAAAAAADGGVPTYTSQVRPLRLKSARVRVTESELSCRRAVAYNVAYERRADTRHDVTVARPAYVNPRERTHKAQWYDDCKYERVTRVTRRWSHHVALKFTPPNWEYLARRYSDWPLVEQPPVCYRLTAAQERQRASRIAATVSFVGLPGEQPIPQVILVGRMPNEGAPARGATPREL